MCACNVSGWKSSTGGCQAACWGYWSERGDANRCVGPSIDGGCQTKRIERAAAFVFKTSLTHSISHSLAKRMIWNAASTSAHQSPFNSRKSERALWLSVKGVRVALALNWSERADTKIYSPVDFSKALCGNVLNTVENSDKCKIIALLRRNIRGFE